MRKSELDADSLIEASLPLLGLGLNEASYASVKMHLETAERLARLVLDFPLDDEAEPAPVFTS